MESSGNIFTQSIPPKSGQEGLYEYPTDDFYDEPPLPVIDPEYVAAMLRAANE